MFLTYEDPRLSAAVAALNLDDLEDLSDFVCVEMEEINDLVIEDFEHTVTGVSVNVEENTLTNDEVIDLLVECVQSFADSVQG